MSRWMNAELMMNQDQIRTLLIDDDRNMLVLLESALTSGNQFDVDAVSSSESALKRIQSEDYDLVITDFLLDDRKITGLVLLKEIVKHSPDTLVIMITAFSSLEITLDSIKAGAYDFLTKPFQLEELLLVTRNAKDLIETRRRTHELERQIQSMRKSFQNLSDAQEQLMDRIGRISYKPDAVDWTPNVPGQQPERDLPAFELRRRRMQDQVSSYQRMGQSIEKHVKNKIELIDSNMSPDDGNENPAYRRGSMKPEPAVAGLQSVKGPVSSEK
jgi:DNA-binding response OmpR family regulator